MLYKLKLEMVPSTAWGQNLRQFLSRRDWDTVRKWCYKKADYRCQCCGGRGTRHPVEAHEIWYWDDGWDVQWLLGVVALCPKCHWATHYGRAIATATNKEKAHREIQEHFVRVLSWTPEQFSLHLKHEFDLHAQRSIKSWDMLCGAWLDAAIFYGAFELQDYQPITTTEDGLIIPKEEFI